MANIEQGQQMIPFITCEIPLCQDVCKLVLGVDVFDLDLRVKINSIEQPIIILITASLSSNTYNKASRFGD